MSNKTHTRIASIYDLRIYLSKLLNQTQRGQVSVERSKAICTVARLLMECLEKEKDLQTEETLEEMEKTLGLEQP